MKAQFPPKRNSRNDRFSRGKLGTKEAHMEKVPNSDWGSLAGGCPGRTGTSKLWGWGREGEEERDRSKSNKVYVWAGRQEPS